MNKPKPQPSRTDQMRKAVEKLTKHHDPKQLSGIRSLRLVVVTRTLR